MLKIQIAAKNANRSYVHKRLIQYNFIVSNEWVLTTSKLRDKCYGIFSISVPIMLTNVYDKTWPKNRYEASLNVVLKLRKVILPPLGFEPTDSGVYY